MSPKALTVARKSKSSLTDHNFPAFYACYLLKSVRTPRSTATYIGSTPSPPRRLRQHNGEITQGAFKTQINRPWVMQMIVHGFPSKIAALQFEWAWQKPHISRHLRDKDGKPMFNGDRRSKYLKTNISVTRSMICSHPYKMWPLRVKLFTEEAVKAWTDASNSSDLAFPPGFEYTVELEGVDGKSGKCGTGRVGPIDITDGQFATDHLRKWTETLASNSTLACSVCKEALHGYLPDPMTIALCPSPTCRAVSHLSCLSTDFLSSGASHTHIIPRGGECRWCHSYVLWGDIVRGCYRRNGRVAEEAERDADGDVNMLESADETGDEALVDRPTSARSKGKVPARPRKVRTKRRAVLSPRLVTGAGDSSDQDAVCPPNMDTAGPIGSTAKASRRGRGARRRTPTGSPSSGSGEFLDLNGVSSGSDEDLTVPSRGATAGRATATGTLAAAQSSSNLSAAAEGHQRYGRRNPSNATRGYETHAKTMEQHLLIGPDTDPEAGSALTTVPLGDTLRHGFNAGKRPVKSTSQDLPEKSEVSRIVRKDVQGSHPHVFPPDKGVETATVAEQEERGPLAAASLSFLHTHESEISVVHRRKRSLAPFPSLLPLSKPHYSRYAERDVSARPLSGSSEEDGDNELGASREPVHQQQNPRGVSPELRREPSAQSESDNSESSRLTRALSYMSVSSGGHSLSSERSAELINPSCSAGHNEGASRSDGVIEISD